VDRAYTVEADILLGLDPTLGSIGYSGRIRVHKSLLNVILHALLLPKMPPNSTKVTIS